MSDNKPSKGNRVFLRLVLEGPRFAEHQYPVSLGADVAAYEECLRYVAKHLYKARTNRSRVPKNFSDWGLVQGEIEPGSTIVPLLLTMGGMQITDGDSFTQARDVVSAAIMAADENSETPQDCPNGALKFFDKIGKNLRADETLYFDVPDATPKRRSKLNQNIRKELVERAARRIKKEKDVVGYIDELDARSRHFRVTGLNGRTVIENCPIGENIDFDSVRNILGSASQGARIKCSIQCDTAGRITEVQQILSCELLSNMELRKAIYIATDQKEGWGGDEDYPAMRPEEWEWLSDSVADVFPAGQLPMPSIAPTPDGTIDMTWDTDRYACSAEFSAKTQPVVIIRLDKQTMQDEVRTLGATTSEEMKTIFATIKEMIEA